MSTPAATRPLTPGVVVTATVVGGVAWFFGVDLLHALLLAMATATLGGLLLLLKIDGTDGWPLHDDTGHDQGARREVARLSWSLSGESRVERRSVRRLRELALGRLAEQGLDLDDRADEAECRRLLGDLAYDTVAPDQRNPPHYRDFVHTLSAVERLRTPALGLPSPDVAGPDETLSPSERTP